VGVVNRVSGHYLMLVTNILLGLILNLALHSVALAYPEPLRKSQQIWAGAGLWIVFTWVLLGLRPILFEPIALIGANMALGYGLAEHSRALQVFSGQTPPALRSLFCALVFGAVTALFYSIFPNPDLRGIAINALAAAALGSAFYFTQGVRIFAPVSSRLMFSVLAALSVIQIIRMLYIAVSMPSPAGSVLQSVPQQLLTAASTAGFALLAFAFSIMCNERLNTELARRVRYDSLTGTLNRAPWRTEFDVQYERRERLSVLLFDIDHFKAVNDQYGHDAGDAVLQAISACARVLFGENVGRLGGEEFAVMMPGTSETQAQALAERFRRAVSHMIIVHAQDTIKATISIGVAEVSRFSSAKSALKAADDAMYAAKRAGRNICLTASALAVSDSN
jgi:diguanylate cyclase (GGDEF)-like protein